MTAFPRFAETGWTILDIRCLKGDWTEEQCAQFLALHEPGLKNAMVEAGYAYIERQLPAGRGVVA